MRIKQQVIDSIIRHAKKDAPLEACGYLASRDGIVDLHLVLKNVDASSEHFSLDPQEQFESVRMIRCRGMKLAAVYHSHPASPARPSAEDISLAYDPNLSYVIVSLNEGVAAVKSFRINKGAVEEETMVVV